jgi:hypothetical protein
MTFFFDENLNKKLSDGMKAFGEDVIHLLQFFPAGTEDTEWLQHIGREQWFLLTLDNRIRKRPFERKALREHSIGAFFLGGKGLSACARIRQVVRSWHRIKEKALATRPPFAFRVSPSGEKFMPIQF